MQRTGAQVGKEDACFGGKGGFNTLELLLTLHGWEGGAESLQGPALRLVHEVEEFPEHLDRQCSKRHFRHKQPNAKSACFKKSRKHFILSVNLTTLRKQTNLQL